MAKPKAPPPADNDSDDISEPDDDEAWAQASPRLKGLFKETLDEWMTEHAPTGDADTGGGSAAAGRGTGGANGGIPDPTKDPKRQRTTPRPSGGSILDVLLGR